MKKHVSLLGMLLIVAMFSTIPAQYTPGYETQTFFLAAALFLIGGFALSKSGYQNSLFEGPQAVVADYFNNYVSSFDLNIRKVLPELYRRYGNQGREFIDMCLALGYERVDGVEVIEHYEEDLIHEKFQVKAQSAGAAGAQVNITLASTALDSDNRFYVRENDVLTFPNRVKGFVKSIDISTPTAPILAVIPLLSADSIPAVTENQWLIITSNMFSEGSTQPSGRAQGIFKYQNGYQIIKESVGGSGSQMATESWIKVYDGKGIQSWFNKAVAIDLDHRMCINMQGALLEGVKVDNPLVVDALNANASLVGAGTEGLFPYMDRVSIPYPYTPGGFTVQDFDAMDKLLNKQYAPAVVAGLLGQNIDMEIQDVLKDYFNFTDINYITKTTNDKLFGMDEDAEKLSAVVNFRYFKKGAGRVYATKRFDAMQDPQTYGAPGYNYVGKGIWFPLGKGKDPKTKKMIPSFGIVYKGLGTYSRKMEMFDIGGAGTGPKQTPVDRRDYYQRTEMGCEVFGGNSFVSMEAAS